MRKTSSLRAANPRLMEEFGLGRVALLREPVLVTDERGGVPDSLDRNSFGLRSAISALKLPAVLMSWRAGLRWMSRSHVEEGSVPELWFVDTSAEDYHVAVVPKARIVGQRQQQFSFRNVFIHVGVPGLTVARGLELGRTFLRMRRRPDVTSSLWRGKWEVLERAMSLETVPRIKRAFPPLARVLPFNACKDTPCGDGTLVVEEEGAASKPTPRKVQNIAPYEAFGTLMGRILHFMERPIAPQSEFLEVQLREVWRAQQRGVHLRSECNWPSTRGCDETPAVPWHIAFHVSAITIPAVLWPFQLSLALVN